MANFDETDILRRAFAAWFRNCEVPIQPSASSSVREHGGLFYAVLESGREVLAVYRLTNAGQLKRLKRWPKELEG